MKATEEIFRKLEQSLAEHESEIKTDEDYEKFIADFAREYNQSLDLPNLKDRPLDAYDYIDMAETASTEREAVSYLKKALKLDPNNLDALAMMAGYTAKTVEDNIEALEEILKIGEKKLRSEGFFDDCMGEFWLAFETRPYMRTRYEYMELLKKSGKIQLAIRECERMIELCDSDNLGVRYTLMTLYAWTNDYKSARKLHGEFSVDRSASFELPFAVVAYSANDYKAAEKSLRVALDQNKDIAKFINYIVSNKQGKIEDIYRKSMLDFGIRIGSIEEPVNWYMQNLQLMSAFFMFFLWAKRTIGPVKTTTSSKGKKNKTTKK